MSTANLSSLPILTEAPEAVAKPRFWRSLEERAGDEEIRDYLEREFPSRLSEWDDPIGRRKFLTMMAASLGLAGAIGCSSPAELIIPHVKAPENYRPGRPLHYATAVSRGGYAQGLLVTSYEGRPTKIEGNPDHPYSLGATDAFAQASILGLYDPDRSQTTRHRGVIATWDDFTSQLADERKRLDANAGAGLRILTETVTSPTLAALLQQLRERWPSAVWHQYEPVSMDNAREGTRLAFGRNVDSLYDFSRADVVVSLDADFLLGGPASIRHARDFIARHQPQDDRPMNRLYVAESTYTITGAMADHRFPIRPERIELIARALAQRVGVAGVAEATLPADVSPRWLDVVARDLPDHRGAGIVLAGAGQPPIVHALAHAINDVCGNLGTTIELIEPVATQGESLARLTADMQAGNVETLLILGGNPVYSAPAELSFAKALDHVRLRVHLAETEDETSNLCHWHIPAAHYLETWGDLRAVDGTVSIQQPLIAPLYQGRSAIELLATLLGSKEQTPYALVQQHWRDEWERDFPSRWQESIRNGTVADSQSAKVTVSLQFDPAQHAAPATPTTADQLAIEIRPDPTIWDGRFANNGWLQELPKPLTKLTWDNVAILSDHTARQYGVKSQDVIRIRVGDRTLETPVFILPGQPDGCVSLTLGYGRERAGRVGNRLGYNANALRPATGPAFTQGTIEATGRRYTIATTQQHWSMEGRDIIRVTTPAELHASHADHHEPHPSLYSEYDYPGNAWGMVINQSACIGCNACVVACQAENNIPVVGKDQVLVNREMHWLRIDRYFDGEPDQPETYFQPMLCQHCEKAPCEVVCPVMATLHDSEGTSNMIYNRCVGTRYCSNNCPYKVRRFNFLQYTDETTPSLKLLRNPEVTVRSRGVMEKCSYCIQRINAGRIEAKKENREIRDGEVVTACQQACPTRAIVFGNLNDPNAEVRQLKQSPLNYGVLAELGTQPRTTYLTRVVNPHPDLPQSTADRHQGTPS